MKKTFLKILSLTFFILSGYICNAQEIPYQIAKNYFVNNTYPDQETHILKITSEKKFNEVFGMATTMGENGKPTEINFSNSFVIAVIDAANSSTESIIIRNLTKEIKKLNLRYAIVKKAVPSSASFRFAKILIIDKEFRKAKIDSNFSRNGGEIATENNNNDDDLQCHPSITFTWSVLEEKCIKPISTKYTFIGDKFNTNGNAGLDFSRDRSKAEIMDSSFSKNLILNKDGDLDIWIEGNYKLEQLKKDLFILKENDKEIAIGKLRN